MFIRGAFWFIFLRRSLAFDLSLFCLSFFDHVIALIQASDVSIRSSKSASDRPIFLASDRCPPLGGKALNELLDLALSEVFARPQLTVWAAQWCNCPIYFAW